ncbi:Ribosomal protein L12 [Prunus dulcis]|uniref:Ribosomal protein L12 n=1 Tax=Prunus dulcis TaxID=3755 RepID=A0A4Y1QP87_PRUDU|nr:Ribosomal protein L12 [Prunus dulcis]
MLIFLVLPWALPELDVTAGADFAWAGLSAGTTRTRIHLSPIPPLGIHSSKKNPLRTQYLPSPYMPREQESNVGSSAIALPSCALECSSAVGGQLYTTLLQPCLCFSNHYCPRVKTIPGGRGRIVPSIPEENCHSEVVIRSPAWTATQQGSGSLSRFATALSRPFSTATTANETQTQKLERIADELLNLTKIERHDYSILFRLKMGLNRYGPAISGIGPTSSESGSASTDAKAVEKTAFDIKIEKFDAAAKIKIIKEVRTFTDLGLKEAKELVEKVPVVVKKGLTKEEAGPIVDKLKELGATVIFISNGL